MPRNSTMRKVSLRNVAAHKLRLALTVLAVVLGTAFISGAFMFTNSLSNTFDSAVNSAYADVDAVVSGAEGSPGVTAEQRAVLEGEPLVDRINVQGSTTVVVATGGTENPQPIQTGGGSSTLNIWYAPEDVVGNPTTLVEGQAPATEREVAVNAAGAETFGVSVGQELLIVDPETRYEVTVTGLYEQELDEGASLLISVPENIFLERYTDGIHVGELFLAGTESTDPQDLVDHLRAIYPELGVETGERLAEQVSELISTALDFINYFLVAFGLVALLVGTFLIANTFSMIVAQRTKEFALLRALGASRRQITNSVILEAFIVGLIGSALGVLAGMGLVALIKAFMASQGAALPGSGLGLSTSAVLVPVVLGTLVTIVSAWAPARKAGQVEPVEAMRSTEASTSQPLAGRTIFGAVLLVLAILLGVGGALWE
ncbi:MAG TPA: FtsX-like permease family protein, partial [Corynebacterium sp.]|nr:FtsX-like permease family protein [Corynebacterium sp.]